MDLSERGSATARHPWEIERFRAYRNVLRDHGALGARRVLDVGAGDGWFSESLLAELTDVGEIVCWDINYNALELTTEDARVVRTTAAPSPGFDLVLVLDVLEHIADPVAFVDTELRPLAAPGTAVLAGVPAHPLLFGDHDRALGHFRRYRPRQLLDQLRAWIDIEDHGPMFTTLVAPRAASVLVERLRHGSDDDGHDGHGGHGAGEWHGGPMLTRTVGAVLAADAAATRRLGRFGRRLPGLSHWAFGRVR